MAGDADDAWNPLEDPSGEAALNQKTDALGKPSHLTDVEWDAFLAVTRGERIREVEVDRLAKLGLIVRTRDGDIEFTQLGHETIRAARSA